MENDEKLLKTKTLADCDKSTPSFAVEKESRSFNLTSSASMGAQLAKSQGNGSRASVEEKIDSFGGAGEEIDVPLKKSSTSKSLRGREAIGGEGVASKYETEKGDMGSVVRAEIGGISCGTTGDDGLTEKAECGGGDDGDDSKLMADNGNGGKGLKALARRGRESKLEAGERSNSDEKPIADILSSISQRTRNRVMTGKKEDVKDVVVVDNFSEMGDEGDHEHGLCHGDFVWGKIKSHPWWPGRIFDPSTASDYALKYKHEGRLLIAYFGDGTFAWCDPSQLKPFVENFEDMSKQSSLKTFVHAVEEAVNEFGRLVELQMTCSCARKKSQSFQPVIVNGGVKEGVLAPESGVEMFSDSQFEPAPVLAAIRYVASFVSVSNFLELTVLKSRLSAFYRAKGCMLPIYHEPDRIEGNLDKDDVPRDVSVQGPYDGDWFVGPEDHPRSQNGLETPLDRSHRRKEKTIAELLGNTRAAEGHSVDRAEGEMQCGELAEKSGRRKRKISDVDQTATHELNGDEAGKIKEEGKSGKLETKLRKRQKIVDENQSHAVGTMIVTRSSARKKDGSARSSTKKKAPADKENGSEVKDQQETERVPREGKPSVSLSIDRNVIAEEGYERISPRERKKSKYLSPPYTSLQQRQSNPSFNIGSEAGGLEFSDVARMGERISKVAGKLVGSPPLVKCSAETFHKSSKGFNPKHEKINSLDHQPQKGDLSSEDGGPVKSIGYSNHVLCEVRSAALDPLHLRKEQSFDTVRGFLSSYRSSNYKNGPNYNFYKKAMADRQKRKKKVPDTEPVSDRKVFTEVDQHTSEINTHERSIKRKLGKSDPKANDEVGPSALFITFPADHSLPSKEEIINMHRKFGLLDELKTEVVPGSSTAKIVFLSSSDAEYAMDSMQKSDPFGTTKVSYKIHHLASAKKANVQNKKKKKSPENQLGKLSGQHPSAAPDSEPLAVVFIKQKLESMTSMLAQTEGKMSEEIKSNLENEVKELLKKVKMMTASS